MQDALVPKPPKPEATSIIKKEKESLSNSSKSAKKQDANASPKDNKPAIIEIAISIN